MKSVLLLCMLCTVHLLSTAQFKSAKYEIGITAGVAAYQGDLTPHALSDVETMRGAISFFASRNINKKIAIRLSATIGGLKGNDADYQSPAWREKRNYRFHSPLTEISGIVVWNVRGLFPNEGGIVNFTPYLFGGIGYSFLNIQRDWSDFNNFHFSTQLNVMAGLKEDIDHDLPDGTMVLPVGVGVRLGVTPHISIIAETAFRHISTDYLDGFSKGANPRLNDHYYTHMVGIVYSLVKIHKGKMDCPKEVK